MLLSLVIITSQLFASHAPAISTNQAKPAIVLDTTSAYTNSIIPFLINVEQADSSAITSYQLVLRYDPAYLMLDSISTVHTISESAFLQYNQPSEGALHIAAAAALPLAHSGPLLQLYFRSRENTGTTHLYVDSYLLNEQEPIWDSPAGLIHILSEHVFLLPRDTVRVLPEQLFELPVFLAPEHQAAFSGSFTLHYDPQYLSLIDLSVDSTLLNAPDALVSYAVHNPGRAQVLFASGTSLAASERPLLSIQFRSASDWGVSSIYLSEMQVDDYALSPHTAEGSVSIQQPFMWGDTTFDTLLSIDDAVFLLQHLLELIQLEGPALIAADVSGNHLVTAYDAALILQHVYGLISCFPADATCQGHKQDYPLHLQHTWTTFPLYINPSDQRANEYELRLGADSPRIFAIALTLDLEGDVKHDFAVSSDLPPDWLFISQSSGNTVHLSLAGTSSLNPGSLFSINMPFQITHVSINDGPSIRVMEREKTRSSFIELEGLYPNPFRHFVHAHYYLSEPAELDVMLYDLLGRPIQQVFRGHAPEGSHQLVIDGSFLASGLYYLSIKVPDRASIDTWIIKQ